MAFIVADKEIIKEALENFKLSSEHDEENRINFIDDIKFARLGIQWPEEIKNQRALENRPCLTYNKIPSFLRQVINDSRQNKPAISIHPVDSGSDVEVAEILTGLIRSIEQSSSADIAYDTAVDNAVTGGIGYIKINLDYVSDDSFDLDIKIDRIVNPLTVYGDHRSTAGDSSDWDYAFIVDDISINEFKSKYPDAKTTSWEDTNTSIGWFEDDNVRVAEYWLRKKEEATIYKLSNGSVLDESSYKEIEEILPALGISLEATRKVASNKICQYIITSNEILETNEWPGKYIPIVPVYGDEVWSEGRRYWLSLFRDAKDAQRSFNYWHTSATEKVALDTKAPWIGKKGTFDSDNNWQTANTKNHAKLEYDGLIPPFRTPAGGVPASDLAMTVQANDQIKAIIGIYDSSLGAAGNETSGKAIIARQRISNIATFHFIDNLTRAIRHVGRIIVELIPYVYKEDRIIRVLGEDGNSESVQVNIKNPPLGLDKLYDLSVGKYDVTVSSGPAYNTRREESVEQMVELIRVYPQGAPLLADLLAKNLDWPSADEISKRFKSMLPPQVQGIDPAQGATNQQAQQQIQMLQQQLNNTTQQLEAIKNDKSIELRKTNIDMYSAETDRLKVIRETNPQVQPQGNTNAY